MSGSSAITWYVRRTIDFTLGDLVLPVVLTWWSAEAHEVVLDFPAGRAVNRWAVDRGLLAEGVRFGQAGLGDVRIAPTTTDHGVDRARRELVLSSPAGHAVLGFPVADLDAFLCETWERVPEGTEQVPVGEIEQYLAFVAETAAPQGAEDRRRSAG